MGSEIRSSRRGQGIGVLVMADGLQCVALRAPIAIVDDQCCAAMIGHALGQVCHNRRQRRAIFNDHAGLCVFEPMGKKRIGLGRRLAKAQAIGVTSQQYLLPARRVATKLPDGKRVKKFIGNEKHWCLRQLAYFGVMDHTGQSVGLELAQPWRGLDHMDW